MVKSFRDMSFAPNHYIGTDERATNVSPKILNFL